MFPSSLCIFSLVYTWESFFLENKISVDDTNWTEQMLATLTKVLDSLLTARVISVLHQLGLPLTGRAGMVLKMVFIV